VTAVAELDIQEPAVRSGRLTLRCSPNPPTTHLV